MQTQLAHSGTGQNLASYWIFTCRVSPLAADCRPVYGARSTFPRSLEDLSVSSAVTTTHIEIGSQVYSRSRLTHSYLTARVQVAMSVYQSDEEEQVDRVRITRKRDGPQPATEYREPRRNPPAEVITKDTTDAVAGSAPAFLREPRTAQQGPLVVRERVRERSQERNRPPRGNTKDDAGNR